METTTIDHDITVFYITATSFPDGIMEAHEKLHKLVPASTRRTFFGISRPENGVITYKAAAEELNAGEAKKLNCNLFTIPKGQYISLIIKDYIQDLQSIDRAFKKLTSHPDIDPNGYCIEWYLSEKDVKCMIKLK